MILAMYRSAGFSAGNPDVFLYLAKAELAEIPHDLRSLAEQTASHDGHSGDAA